MRAIQRKSIPYILLLTGAVLLMLQSCVSSRGGYGCSSDMNHSYRAQGR